VGLIPHPVLFFAVPPVEWLSFFPFFLLKLILLRVGWLPIMMLQLDNGKVSIGESGIVNYHKPK